MSDIELMRPAEREVQLPDGTSLTLTAMRADALEFLMQADEPVSWTKLHAHVWLLYGNEPAAYGGVNALINALNGQIREKSGLRPIKKLQVLDPARYGVEKENGVRRVKRTETNRKKPMAGYEFVWSEKKDE